MWLLRHMSQTLPKCLTLLHLSRISEICANVVPKVYSSVLSQAPLHCRLVTVGLWEFRNLWLSIRTTYYSIRHLYRTLTAPWCRAIFCHFLSVWEGYGNHGLWEIPLIDLKWFRSAFMLVVPLWTSERELAFTTLEAGVQSVCSKFSSGFSFIVNSLECASYWAPVHCGEVAITECALQFCWSRFAAVQPRTQGKTPLQRGSDFL